MHKTMGGSAQPNIGSKTKIFQGIAPDPIEWGYLHPSNPMWPPCYVIRATKGGGSAPPLTPRLTTWASRGKNITQPNILPLVVFFPRGPQESLVIYPPLQCPLFLYTKRTSQSSQILSMHLQYSSKCPPLLETPFCLLSYPSESDTEHQCALYLNDMQDSLPRKLHFVYHSLSL